MASGTPGRRGSGANAVSSESPSQSESVAPGAARTASARGSPAGHRTLPDGVNEVVSIQLARGGGMNRDGRRTVRTVPAVSLPSTAWNSKRIRESPGNGTHGIHAPFGQTRTGSPLTVSEVRPFPVEPKRKLESRASTTLPSAGYSTLSDSGPRTESIPGSAPGPVPI